MFVVNNFIKLFILYCSRPTIFPETIIIIILREYQYYYLYNNVLVVSDASTAKGLSLPLKHQF